MGKKIVAARQLSVGEILTASNIKIVSPNDGLPPYELDNILGSVLKCDIDEEGAINWECVE